MKKQGHSAIAVAAKMDRREDDAAARPFAADGGVHGLDHLDHIRLADRRSVHRAAELLRDVVDHRRRRQVHHHVAVQPLRAPPPPRARARRRYRGRVPFSSITASRSPSGSCAKPMSHPFVSHQLRNLAKRFRASARPRAETASSGRCSSRPDRSRATPSESRAHHRSRAVHGIQRDAEIAAARDQSTSTCRSTRSMCSRCADSKSSRHVADLFVARLVKLALVIEVDQFLPLVVVEEQAAAG